MKEAQTLEGAKQADRNGKNKKVPSAVANKEGDRGCNCNIF